MFFCFNDTATTEIYTLSLHDALPIWCTGGQSGGWAMTAPAADRTAGPRLVAVAAWDVSLLRGAVALLAADRKSTRLNSSHANISYAVFCLKKKKPHTTRKAMESAATN